MRDDTPGDGGETARPGRRRGGGGRWEGDPSRLSSGYGFCYEDGSYGSVVYDLPAPDEATDAEPGSEDKIRVMMDRANRGRRLHHPGDRRHHGGGEGLD